MEVFLFELEKTWAVGMTKSLGYNFTSQWLQQEKVKNILIELNDS